MALATSGALTLDQIHVEAGGTTGTTCSLNDSDIRGLTAASGRTINSTLGTNIDFADFYGASAVPILQQTVDLNLVKTRIQILTGIDGKGNPQYTTVGYSYTITVKNWNSLSNNSGTNNVANYLHTGSSSATSPGSQDFLGALHANVPYDMIKFEYTNLDYNNDASDSRIAQIDFYKLNSGATNHTPAWDANAAAPTGWNYFKLEFTYDGTTYTWNYPRSDFTYTETQVGSQNYGYYYIKTNNSSADIAFAPTLSLNTNTTISNATITIT